MASAKRINVLIYSGPSTSLPSVRHATWTLRRLLGPNYAVHTLSSDQLLKEPWPSTCALLVIPGGADMGYCRVLNGEGNRRIKTYVQSGGKYLGLCAGGYYGSARCEFEVGRKGWEVIGERELAFYPGTCRGLAFKGFVYGSEKGARAVKLRANAAALNGSSGEFNSYYNGGGAFVDSESLQSRNVEVLASFEDELAVDAGDSNAAVVYCKVGDGAAVLTSPHPEFAGINLNREEPSNPNYGEVVDALLATDQARTDFLKACLSKLGLNVSQDPAPVPSLSSLHLSSAQPSEIGGLLQKWQEEDLVVRENDGLYIKGENDTFRLKETDGWNMDSLRRAVSDIVPASVKDAVAPAFSSPQQDSSMQADGSADRILDYNAVTKTLIPHTATHPAPKETPQFNHAAFYSALQGYQSKHPTLAGTYGRTILYGEVVTSTQTLLEKNFSLLSTLPIGTTATATTQVSGRGRGTNVWVSPPGSMMFSTVLKHPLSLSTSAPVVFIQYLAAIAIVQGLKAYDRGYEKMPVKLKWPNDIYALDPNARPDLSKPANSEYVKIGGILVNSSYSGGDYTLIVGIGLNLSNAAPTTSIHALARAAHLPPPSYEKLLASILVHFELLYARFAATGWNHHLENLYYELWLHGDQEVTLEMEGGAKARVKGITRDWGLLVVEELGWEGRKTGKIWELQSDSNSFDFFKGLLRRKM